MLCAKSLQSCPILCDPMDHSPPGSSVHGILQARILERVAISSSRRSFQPRDPSCVPYISCTGGQVLYHERHLGSLQFSSVQWLSRVQLFATLWTVAHQAPLSMGFSKQEYWSGLPWPPPGDLPNPGIEPASPVPPALAGRFFTTEPPGDPLW